MTRTLLTVCRPYVHDWLLIWFDKKEEEKVKIKEFYKNGFIKYSIDDWKRLVFNWTPHDYSITDTISIVSLKKGNYQ